MFVQVIYVSTFLLFSVFSSSIMHFDLILAYLFEIYLFKHIDTIHKKKIKIENVFIILFIHYCIIHSKHHTCMTSLLTGFFYRQIKDFIKKQLNVSRVVPK